ncbi:MAG: hypothetical protein J6W29_01130 [Neisseriaceae bacterium]|nr:hypothetical protein [Neisseriaceae bacterium]
MRTSSGTVNINYLFDSAGRWIAFRKRRYVFDRDSRWIGWTPWDDNEVYSPNGSYLGTITYGNRLYCYRERDDRGTPGTIEPPPFPGTYSEPTSPGRAVLLPWANDLDFSWHAELDWSSDLGMDVEQNMIFGHQEDPRSRRNIRPEAYRINEHNLPALDLDTEFSLGSSDRTEVEIPAQSRHAVARDDEQDERHSRVRRRYDDDEDDRNYRSSRSRSRYEDEDDYDDRSHRSRSRGRYDDDEDDYDNRGYRSSRSRSRYEDENDYDAHGYRPRSRGRYDDEDDYDNRGYRSSRPRSRYDDDDDRGYRPQSRRRYDDEDDYDNRGYRSSRPRSRYDDDDDDDRGYRPQSRRRYEDERDERDSRDRRSRISSRYDDDDDDEGDHYTRRSSDRARRDEDNELDRKREIDRLRLVFSKHAKKASESEDDITLLQPLKKSN